MVFLYNTGTSTQYLISRKNYIHFYPKREPVYFPLQRKTDRKCVKYKQNTL